MRKFLSSLLIVVLLVGLTGFSGCGGASTGGTTNRVNAVHLKAISFVSQDHPLAAMIPRFIDLVKEKSNEEVVIDYIGGPEVIPPLEQVEALRKGKMVDMTFSPSAYYEALVPEGLSLNLSRLTPWEERQNGFYDLMVEHHKKANLMYLGRWLYNPQYLWSKKPLESLDDLRGMKMRTLANFDRFMQRLGIVPVSIAAGDVYTALERGMIEGFGWPILGVRKDGWSEIAKYVIGHSFYDSQNCAILMNLDKWNSLSPKAQQAVKDAAADFEREMVAYFKKAIDDELKILREQEGVKVIEFPPDQAKKFVDTAYEVQWEALMQKCPDSVPKLRELCEKK